MWIYVIAAVIGLTALTSLIYFLGKKNGEKNKPDKAIGQLSGDMVEGIIHSIPDMIFIVDADYKIRRVIGSDPEKLSAPLEVVIGMSLQDAVDPEYTASVLDGIQKALSSDKVQEVEYAVTFQNRTKYFEGRFKRVQEGLVACFERDITERKEADNALMHNEALMIKVLDNMPMPVFIKDIDNGLRYTFWNKGCVKELGRQREEIIGKTDFDIYDAESAQKYRELDQQVIAQKKSYTNQTAFVTPDGRQMATIVNKNTISTGIHNWLITTRWDVSELIKYQEQLTEVNQQLQMAFAVTSSVPIIWNIETDIISFKIADIKNQTSDFFKERDGVPSTEVINYLHPDDREDTAQLFDDMRQGRSDIIYKELRYDINGDYKHYYEVYLMLEKTSEDGRPCRAVGTMRNITERKLYEKSIVTAKNNLEEVRRINELILDNASSGLVYINSDFIVEWENVSRLDNFPADLRYNPGSVCYKSAMGLDEPCADCVVKRALQSGKVEQGEKILKNGSIVAITGSPTMTDKGKRGVVLKCEDVTASRKAAEELKRAKEAAEASDKLKSMFISNMSHEIRTPLNAIVGFSELLIHTADVKEREDYMSVIKRNNELLLQLINDILDLSKIEAGTLEFVYDLVDINEMFQYMELSSQQKIDEGAQLSIVFKPTLEECVIYSEKNRLQQVVLNFINNALKFTQEGTIEIGYELQENGLKFFVSDTGRGIPKDKLGDIFKRFVKLDNFVSGTGLGLAICQSIINRLDGEIGVESEEGKGSTFWFTLPVKPITVDKEKEVESEVEDIDESPTSIQTNRDAIKGMPVLLIAEDTVDNFTLYNTLLGKKYKLLHAWNGREVVEVYQQYKDEIDLIIMDIKMPEMNGYEATALIRQHASDIPIIAASAYAFSEDVTRIMNSGFNDYISKPINRTALMSMLDNYLQTS